MILTDLNKPQLEAVQHLTGALMILAGAGSGKTRVLTRRIANLIKQGISPNRILAVSFTRKASNEMKERVDVIVGKNKCWIGTFHAISLRMLKQYGHQIGLDKFTVCDADEQKRLLKNFYKQKNIIYNKYAPWLITQYRDKKKTKLDYPLNIIYTKYMKHLDDNNMVDFYTMLHKANQLTEALSQQWDYVMVDEFQDTNEVQFSIINQASKQGNICVVGDDDQSIYGWRGAKPEFLINFKKIYPDAKVIKLEQNYRSSKYIIDAANKLIFNNEERADKELWTANPNGEKINIIQFKNYKEEAEIVADLIDDYDYKDVTILYRINAQSLFFETIFKERHIPYVVKGSMQFYNRTEIKDTLAYLRILIDPNDEDIIRVINKPKRTIGQVTIDRLLAENKPLWEVINDIPDTIPYKEGIQFFVDLICELQLETTLIKKVKLLFNQTNYLGYGLNNTKSSFNRVENLKAFLESIEDISVKDYLDSIVIEKEDDDPDKVTLMTIHKSKGLEFPVVFIVNCSENNMPKVGPDGEITDIEEERRLMYVAMTRAKKTLFISHNNPSRFINELPQNCLELI